MLKCLKQKTFFKTQSLHPTRSSVMWIRFITKMYVILGQRNGFRSGGAMKHWNHGRQEKIMNSRPSSSMAKKETFWPWWQSFNGSCFETVLLFSFAFSFLFLRRKNQNYIVPLNHRSSFPFPVQYISTYFQARSSPVLQSINL